MENQQQIGGYMDIEANKWLTGIDSKMLIPSFKYWWL